jgi:hypothetical protein
MTDEQFFWVWLLAIVPVSILFLAAAALWSQGRANRKLDALLASAAPSDKEQSHDHVG